MGMTSIVYGIKPPNERWKRMKAIWEACDEADIPIPDEVDEYFDCGAPDEKGVIVEIPSEKYSEEASSGFEIDLDKLPKDVKRIRFLNSW